MTFMTALSNVLNRPDYTEGIRAQDACGVIIDMQETFVSELSEGARERLIRAQGEVIHFCASAGIPIFVVELSRGENGGTVDELKEKLDAAAQLGRVEYFEKSNSSILSNREFLTELEQTGASYLLLMGMNANACVRMAAIYLDQYHFRSITSPEVVADAGFERPDLSWFAGRGMLVESLVPLVRMAR